MSSQQTMGRQSQPFWTRGSAGGRPAMSLFRGVRRQADGARWEVTQADLNMYRVITGREANADEAADVSKADELTTAADAVDDRAECGLAVPARRTWSPVTFYASLRRFCAAQSNLRVARPKIANWVRRVSSEARRRLQETGTRIGIGQ